MLYEPGHQHGIRLIAELLYFNPYILDPFDLTKLKRMLPTKPTTIKTSPSTTNFTTTNSRSTKNDSTFIGNATLTKATEKSKSKRTYMKLI